MRGDWFRCCALCAIFCTAVASGARAGGELDWRQDAPGHDTHIDVATLPPPFATPSAGNPPRVIARPADARLSLPPGFHIEVFATGLAGPRKMLETPGGDVLVSETYGGRISLLHPTRMHPTGNGAREPLREVLAAGLRQPFGLAFYPDAQHPRWLYVAESNRVVRYPYPPTGDAARTAQIVVPDLPSGGAHFTRDLAFSPDGKRMFVSVGSASNIAAGMAAVPPAGIAAWESQHAPGAAWGGETDRADILVFDVDSRAPGRVFATGLRNCVSLTVQPGSGELWCTTNERDCLGDDLVPDYSTHVAEGAFYGWPWYYLGAHPDPRVVPARPDLRDRVTVPDILYQAHSAALNLTFYTACTGASAFPAEYVGDAFVAFHGSWNRDPRTGYKLVRVRMRGGRPTGEYTDFLTGFMVDDADVWGRPVATAELADGSLLMSDDGSNTIYRISYAPGPPR